MESDDCRRLPILVDRSCSNFANLAVSDCCGFDGRCYLLLSFCFCFFRVFLEVRMFRGVRSGFRIVSSLCAYESIIALAVHAKLVCGELTTASASRNLAVISFRSPAVLVLQSVPVCRMGMGCRPVNRQFVRICSLIRSELSYFKYASLCW